MNTVISNPESDNVTDSNESSMLVAPGMPDPNTQDHVPIKGRLLRLMIWMLPANLAVYILWGAIPSVLLPLQVGAFDEANKVRNLAIITTVGAFAAMIAQPIAGAVSDRTHSKLGRRAPWMLIGALIGSVALVGLSMGHSLIVIFIGWVFVQASFNFVQGPLTAIMPDRVPVMARGTFAAITGMATMLGAIGGQILGAMFAKHISLAYATLASFVLLFIVLFIVFNPDASSKQAKLPDFKVKDFLATFWVNPLRYPNFAWAFIGRLLLYAGYFAVTGYNLYTLQGYIGLSQDAAVSAVPVLGVASLVGMVPSIGLAGPLSDKIGRRKPFVLASALIVGLGLTIPWLIPTKTAMIAMAFICGLGFGAFSGVDQVLMTQVLPDTGTNAKDLGVVNIAATLPQTLAPAIGGGIVLVVGYVGLFPVGIVLSILGAFSVLMIKGIR
ncbi:MFS transporter [Bifidobacterium sp. ESL0732]|uniref:MFS transporter n=1 Tax=Bifidobacterium sp. ESL0732 TaxID=2983222 RepID=UPI0023F93B9F|nr:MFS transporter [Bifidobacterium sp. ESL0732]WEV64829.1 MFS transporter [Bifidobacterium sp. ESL0732]